MRARPHPAPRARARAKTRGAARLAYALALPGLLAPCLARASSGALDDDPASSANAEVSAPRDGERRPFALAHLGVLAIDTDVSDWLGYQYGIAGGVFRRTERRFGYTIGGALEHWINLGGGRREAHVVRVGPELRIGWASERVFLFMLAGAGLGVGRIDDTRFNDFSSGVEVGVGLTVNLGAWVLVGEHLLLGTQFGPDIDVWWTHIISRGEVAGSFASFEWKAGVGWRF